MSQGSSRNGYGEAAFEDDSISLGEIFRILARGTRLITLVTILVAMATVLWVATRTPKYNAQATLLLEADESAGGVLSELASLTADPAAEAEIALIRSRSIAEVTAANPNEFTPNATPFNRTEPDFDPFEAINERSLESSAAWGEFDLSQEMDRLGLSTIVERFDLRPSEGILRRLRGEKTPVHRLRAQMRILPGHEEGGERPESLDILFTSGGSMLVAPHTRFLFPAAMSTADGAIEFEYQSGERIEAFGYELFLGATGDYVSKRYRVSVTDEEDAVLRLMESISAAESGRKTNVVHVGVEHLNPFEAAEIANALAKNYIRRSILIGSKKAERTSSFISRQLQRQQAELAKHERDLSELQAERPEGISLSDSTKAVIDQLTALELERTQNELSLSATEQALDHLAKGDDQAFARIGRETPNLIALTYFQELASLDAEISRIRSEYTLENPALRALEEARSGLRERVKENLLSQVEGHRDHVASMSVKIGELETRLGGLPKSQVALAEGIRKVQTGSEIVAFLLKSQQEADITAAATSATAVLIDPAVPDQTRAFPRITLFAAIGTLLGLLLGCIAALLQNSLQAGLHTEAEVERASGLPVLGAVPDFERGRTRIKGAKKGERILPMRDEPSGAQAEAYRSIRASLRQAMHGEDALKTLACTSCMMGEGKTVTNADLALVFAKAGRKVLLVDCDLRKPQVHNLFQIDRSPGFGEVLEGRASWEACVKIVGDENLDILPAGIANSSPGELLAGESALEVIDKMKSAYDLIVFDLPPAVVVADVANFASNLDALLLVYRSGRVPGRILNGAVNKLRQANVNILGVVVNAVYVGRTAGSYGYGYGYGYGYEEASS